MTEIYYPPADEDFAEEIDDVQPIAVAEESFASELPEDDSELEIGNSLPLTEEDLAIQDGVYSDEQTLSSEVYSSSETAHPESQPVQSEQNLPPEVSSHAEPSNTTNDEGTPNPTLTFPEKPAQPAHKDLLAEMRSLLRDYPMQTPFKTPETIHDMISNILVVYDFLSFCRYKTTKQEIRDLAEAELAEMDSKIRILEVRQLFYRTRDRISFGRGRISRTMERLVAPQLNYIADKVQMYSLAMPAKDKPYMHLKSAQGLPAATAESFESAEIEEGERIPVDAAFRIDMEGKVQQVT